ncbi:hypothetical protein BHU72_14950 [Desulfuribacillus stibiiarsenatis]|uniref:Uncharacterized protein n=1 Tax=Desulfuribacillus stibiiarsenatis TaxID=1390249 RepID=A0A1E5L748_9FIRM|nr:hypothetical protein [Desulfuribacillus stibiiarsenatis]OEH85977.1 hypothetical protein BHU72_14950 [Desulfuribacillus stibiiarsenatis]
MLTFIDALKNLFSHFQRARSFFNKAAFKQKFNEYFQHKEIINRDLPSVLLDMFVADVSENIGFNCNSDRFKFVQERRSQYRDETEYRVMNSNYLSLKQTFNRQIMQCVPNHDERTFSSYVYVEKETGKNPIFKLAILLELLGLATYEIIGGKNSEIFIRVNDPSKLARLYQGNYRNALLTEIERKKDRSQKVLSKFMIKQLTNEDRWDIIENYFLGRDEWVSSKLEL